MSDNSEPNADLAAAVTAHYDELRPLITDDRTAEAFQLTYMRMTTRWDGSDVVLNFKKELLTTLRELDALDLRQRCVVITYNDAISTQTEKEAEGDNT